VVTEQLDNTPGFVKLLRWVKGGTRDGLVVRGT
jgi:hypothetical protein